MCLFLPLKMKIFHHKYSISKISPACSKHCKKLCVTQKIKTKTKTNKQKGEYNGLLTHFIYRVDRLSKNREEEEENEQH